MLARQPQPGLRSLVLALLLALPILAVQQTAPTAAAPAPLGQKLVWFTPDPGTLDMRDLLIPGSPWPTAWSHVSVFKFYQQQMLEPVPGAYFLPNEYRALRGRRVPDTDADVAQADCDRSGRREVAVLQRGRIGREGRRCAIR